MRGAAGNVKPKRVSSRSIEQLINQGSIDKARQKNAGNRRHRAKGEFGVEGRMRAVGGARKVTRIASIFPNCVNFRSQD